MNVGLKTRVSWVGMIFRSRDSHCGNLVFGSDGLGSVDIALQKVDVWILFGERFEHWGNLVTWTTPGSLNHEATFADCMKFDLRTT